MVPLTSKEKICFFLKLQNLFLKSVFNFVLEVMCPAENIVLKSNVSDHRYRNQIKHCDILKKNSSPSYPTGASHEIQAKFKNSWVLF